MTKNQKNKSSSSQAFLEKKELLELDLENAKIKHKMKMDELAFFRESDRQHHERELERGRIKSAEIRKTLMFKQGNAYHG